MHYHKSTKQMKKLLMEPYRRRHSKSGFRVRDKTLKFISLLCCVSSKVLQKPSLYDFTCMCNITIDFYLDTKKP